MGAPTMMMMLLFTYFPSVVMLQESFVLVDASHKSQ